MIEKADFYSLRSLENIFVGTSNIEIEYDSSLLERNENYKDVVGNLIPRKFLPNNMEDILVEKLLEKGIKPTRIWLIPFEKNEYSDERITKIVITLSKENFNPETERCSRIHLVVRDILDDVACGNPITCVTWDEVINTCLPNSVRPKYQPNWSI